jgi:putative Ca2+/H+ antiporter (TMEM165/GDT1 family)
MILVSEFGDKTFFIAAIMAMRQSRTEVFLSAMTALIIMTILSAAMGLTLPHLLDPKITAAAATVLFFFFGLKLLYDAYLMDPNAVGKEEMEEVEEELEKASALEPDSQTLLEQGGLPSKAKPLASLSRQFRFFLGRFLSPVFIQCATMTFLAEWGDRSQIATIALAAAKNPIGVSIGAILGHAICTGVAVLGGKLLANRISERTISWVGGLLFLMFAVHSVISQEVRI